MGNDLVRYYLANCIKNNSEIESRNLDSFEICKRATECIKNDIMLAYIYGVISMKSVNDVTIFRGLDEKEILEILG